MQIVERRLKELIPYPNNPRNNDGAVDYVANSIKEFGFKVPIIIDKDSFIVCGHTRYKAAKKLKLETVPCIVADDLNEQQLKAFRLADNKVSEKAEWDLDSLELELGDILDFDMADFGFEKIEEVFPDLGSGENERERTIDAYNLKEYDPTQTEGKYQMPVIAPCDYVPTDLIGFNYAKTSKNKDAGIHFYIDNYQFERIWNEPHEYVDLLSEYSCVLTPDFSLYTEMPIAMMIWNTYRSRLIGQLMQTNDIRVIPTVSWCQKETFEFCFDGLPRRSTLSVSTIGVKRQDENFKLWKDGMDEMIKRLEPKRLLVYGGEVEYDYGNIEVIYYKNHVTENMKE